MIINGHGGNTVLLQYFAQVQLDSPRDYVVYTVNGLSAGSSVPAAARPSRPGVDGHAGEGEISNVMASRPELVHTERSASESGADLNRLTLPDGVSTGIWWYAKFPNHYQGDSSSATAARGDAATKAGAERIADAIRAIKADDVSPRLQKEFFEKSIPPIPKQ
jgi:creatinine amidohydrolase